MDLTAFQEARIADMTAATEPGRSPWRQCPTCKGRMGLEPQPSLTVETVGATTRIIGKLYLCPVCLGLGKVTAE